MNVSFLTCVLAAGFAWAVPQAATLLSRDARCAAWREALELDLAREVLTDGVRETAPGGALAHDALAISLVARALMQSGDIEAARALVTQAPPDLASQGELDLVRVRIALEEDALERALDLVLAAPRTIGTPLAVRHPEIPESYLLAARALVRTGDLERAAPLCARFVELAPYDAEAPAAWHMLAQAAVARQDLETARRSKASAEASAQWQAFYKTRRLQARAHPDDPLPHLGIAELWLAADEYARATEQLREILARWPRFCRAYDLLGDVEHRRSQGAGAESLAAARSAAYAWFAKALDCDANLPEAHFHLGMLAAEDGDRGRARPHLEWIVASRFEPEPRFLAAHLTLARILRDSDSVEAAQHMTRYRALGGREDP